MGYARYTAFRGGGGGGGGGGRIWLIDDLTVQARRIRGDGGGGGGNCMLLFSGSVSAPVRHRGKKRRVTFRII